MIRPGSTLAIALAAIDAGADVIELGVPFSDPLADGPVIQRASERAVARGTRLTMCWRWRARFVQRGLRAGQVIFTYLNPILRMGMSDSRTQAAAAGADGVLVTDLIVEEAHEYLAEMARASWRRSFWRRPPVPDERLKAIAANSKGFVYAISRVGITGKQQSLQPMPRRW